MKTVSLSDPTAAALVILAMCSILFQLIAYCWGGNAIIVESNLTSSSAYKSCWYNEDNIFQTNLKIFSTMAKQPLSLSAFGLFDLSITTLRQVSIDMNCFTWNSSMNSYSTSPFSLSPGFGEILFGNGSSPKS
uniref:Uncharacterized protein n=1 Tax=Bracon brevicornis TaxID=1563983 RepID=A0A6V7KN53_9HYME